MPNGNETLGDILREVSALGMLERSRASDEYFHKHPRRDESDDISQMCTDIAWRAYKAGERNAAKDPSKWHVTNCYGDDLYIGDECEVDCEGMTIVIEALGNDSVVSTEAVDDIYSPATLTKSIPDTWNKWDEEMHYSIEEYYCRVMRGSAPYPEDMYQQVCHHRCGRAEQLAGIAFDVDTGEVVKIA